MKDRMVEILIGAVLIVIVIVALTISKNSLEVDFEGKTFKLKISTKKD